MPWRRVSHSTTRFLKTCLHMIFQVFYREKFWVVTHLPDCRTSPGLLRPNEQTLTYTGLDRLGRFSRPPAPARSADLNFGGLGGATLTYSCHWESSSNASKLLDLLFKSNQTRAFSLLTNIGKRDRRGPKSNSDKSVFARRKWGVISAFRLDSKCVGGEWPRWL